MAVTRASQTQTVPAQRLKTRSARVSKSKKIIRAETSGQQDTKSVKGKKVSRPRAATKSSSAQKHKAVLEDFAKVIALAKQDSIWKQLSVLDLPEASQAKNADDLQVNMMKDATNIKKLYCDFVEERKKAGKPNPPWITEGRARQTKKEYLKGAFRFAVNLKKEAQVVAETGRPFRHWASVDRRPLLADATREYALGDVDTDWESD